MHSSFLINLGIRGAAVCATFAMVFLVARALGPDGAGLFFLSIAVVRGIAEIGRLGMHQSIVRFAAPAFKSGDKERAATFYWSGLSLVLVISLFAAGLVSIASNFVMPMFIPDRNSLWSLLSIFAWVGCPLAILTYSAFLVQSHGSAAQAALFEVGLIPTGVCIGLLSLATVASVSLWDVVALYQGLCFLVALLAVLKARYLLGRVAALSRTAMNGLLFIGRPLFVVGFLRYLAQNAPLLILGIYIAVDQAGVFSVAHRLAMVLSLLLTSVNTIMLPRFAIAAEAENPSLLEQELRHAGRMLAGFGLPLTAAMVLGAPMLLRTMGEEFVAGEPLLILMLCGQAVNILTASSGAVLSMSGYEKVLRRNAVIATLASLLAAITLIPLLESVGAAIAVSLALALQSCLAAWAVYKRLGINPLPVLPTLQS